MASDDRDKRVVGRFAPSPTGRMHAGNIFSALMSWLIVKSNQGRIVLRIEDLDKDRSREEYSTQVQRDFEMLGLFWDDGPYFQHDRDEAYNKAFSALDKEGLVYPCFCSRADLHASSAPHRGEKFVYPGTCRRLSSQQIAVKSKGRNPAWRLIVDDSTICINDLIQGEYSQKLNIDCGDFLIKRSDGAFAYQLAVVVDDAAQDVNCVIRGIDLLNSTPQQAYLQKLLDFQGCSYAHIPLLVAEKDRRLSKRDHDASMDELMKRFGGAQGVLGHIAYVVGLIPDDQPCSAYELLDSFDLTRIRESWEGKIQIQWF
jgi:glutamyl-queuosine tRNA(Asp) synthetase